MNDLETHQLETQVMKAMRTVYDPEIPVNIYDLGLIYGLQVNDAGVAHIKMTLTAPSCPVAGILPGQVEAKVREVPGITDVKLELVWDPPWDRNKMSDAAKLELGFDLGFEVVNVTKLVK
ncbi:MAG TPA: SUF system Fe-S cluster assembly protein [Bryobacteraceae bacterium]|jgi:FeS assembly SUF system protein|nr:SUF system Fe-S cluster assembly protein [Bryobacteraceae bacterium]